MAVTHLVCWACGKTYSSEALHNLCTCGKPLRVDYDLSSLQRRGEPQFLCERPCNLWRYREVLPLPEEIQAPTLGEGGTPLVPADALAAQIGMQPGTLF